LKTRPVNQTRTTSDERLAKKRLHFNNKADAMAKAGKIEAILLSHGAGRLNDLGQLVSNGVLTRRARALAIHGKTLSDNKHEKSWLPVRSRAQRRFIVHVRREP
jgi:hypothetical protein